MGFPTSCGRRVSNTGRERSYMADRSTLSIKIPLVQFILSQGNNGPTPAPVKELEVGEEEILFFSSYVGM